MLLAGNSLRPGPPLAGPISIRFERFTRHAAREGFQEVDIESNVIANEVKHPLKGPCQEEKILLSTSFLFLFRSANYDE